MKKNWMKWLIIVLVIAVLVAGAQWAGTLDDRGYTDEGGYARSSEPNMLMSAKTSAMYDTAVEESMDYGVSGSTIAAAGASYPENEARKLVRTADMTIRTRQFDEAVQKVQELLSEAGGYVESLYEHGETGSRRLNLYMRVPSEKLDAFLSSMEGAGRVTDRSQSTTDMTTQYQDNAARLKTLYDKRDRLNDLMLKAETVADLIEIESAIADTQYQIDRYETSQRGIDREVDMSAVSVNLMEERPADTAQADLTLLERIAAGIEASVESLVEFSRDLVVFLAVILPWIIPAAVILLAVRFIIRKRKGNK